MSKLNPQIVEIEIGTKTLRTVKLYPLSIHDQLETTDILVAAFAELANANVDIKSGKVPEVSFLERLVDLVKENLSDILLFLTDPEDNVTTKEITNEQLIFISQVLYEVNYESFSKNLKDLTNKVKKVLGSLNEQSQPSSETTQDTD